MRDARTRLAVDDDFCATCPRESMRREGSQKPSIEFPFGRRDHRRCPIRLPGDRPRRGNRCRRSRRKIENGSAPPPQRHRPRQPAKAGFRRQLQGPYGFGYARESVFGGRQIVLRSRSRNKPKLMEPRFDVSRIGVSAGLLNDVAIADTSFALLFSKVALRSAAIWSLFVESLKLVAMGVPFDHGIIAHARFQRLYRDR